MKILTNKEKFEDLIDWFHKKIKSPYHNFIQGIENIFSWLPIIWKDREFDKAYLYIILHKKLKLMEDFYLSDKPACMNADKLGKQIRIARILCGRLAESDYLMNALIDVEKKYGVSKLEFEPSTDHPGYFQMMENRTPQEHLEYTRAYKHADYMEKQDKEYFFNFIQKKIDGWWD